MARRPYENDDVGSDYQFTGDGENGAADYQYEEAPMEQASNPGASGDANTAIPMATNSKKKLIIAGAVVVVLAVAGVVYHSMSSSKVTTSSVVSSTTAEPTTTTTSSTNSAQAQAIQSIKVPQLTNTEKNDLSAVPDLEKAVAALKTASTSLADSVSQAQFDNQTNISNLQNSINTLNSNLEKVNSTVSTLSKAFYQQQQELRKQAYAQQEAQQKAAAATRQKKQYFVDAVIPGRAWLKGADGSTITVTVGNKLPGYGTVLSIDPYSGTVKTSEGDISYAASAS